ncbi:MAG: peptidylprolyl isomerase [Planctomycetes bacterium]|nr:peptidylprolyl isomerase [Planctomycetota bacterium]
MSDTSNTRVRLETCHGDMLIEFFPELAPKHVENFISLTQSGFYDGTKFHRVIPGFMIQGGDPNTKSPEGPANRWGTGGPGHSVDAEFNDKPHVKGILSMARSQDPNSAGSQFFVVHGEASFLDNNYTVFGQVVDGLEALDAIVAGECKPGGEGSSPVEPVEITKAQVIGAE